MRTLNPEEIRLVAEINESAQRLDIIGQAKALGFILGLSADKTEAMPRTRIDTAQLAAAV